MPRSTTRSRLIFAALALLATPVGMLGGEASAPQAAGAAEPKIASFLLSDLLPTAWQKRPKLRFNVFTEMSPEGRKRPVPTADKPLTFFAPPGTYQQPGWLPISGENPPPWAQLQEAMLAALAQNGYVPIAHEQQRPDVLLVFNFGSHGTDLAFLMSPEATPPISAEEMLNAMLTDAAATQDVIQRARFIGGEKVAAALFSALKQEAENMRFNNAVGSAAMPVNPNFGSPFQLLLRGSESDVTRHVVELAFHTCYFVTATAYDFAGVENKQKIPLWQTRMTVEARGVVLHEVLKPLIIQTAPFIGRETPEAIFLDKRIDREGRIEIGTAVEVRDVPSPTAPAAP